MLFFEVDFLFLFLVPVLLLSWTLVGVGLRPVAPWLASGASLVFLGAFSWISVVVAVISLSINYFAGRYLLARRRPWVLASAIAANILILTYFKYSVLIDATFGGQLPFAWRIVLPLGISFYTFQQIAFLSDIYRGKTTSFTLRSYVLFKLFFPQLIAGPIVHFERVRSSYERWPTFNARSVRYGLLIMALGFLKKMVGDYFGTIADASFDKQADLHFFSAWAGAAAFSFQIYFDFSGYSDMAVGLARIFGVSLPFNFNSPYKSKNIGEFWRRWHITLSTWLRDYLYIPLGGNRHGRLRMFAALFVTMALGGLWHGAGWTFLAWGILHGAALIFVRVMKVPLPAVIRRGVFLLFILLTWILFRSSSFAGAVEHYAALFDLSPSGVGIELRRLTNVWLPFVTVEGAGNSPEQIGQVLALLAAAVACLAMPNSQQIALWMAARKIRMLKLTELPALAAILFLLSLAFISPDTANAFIYFAF